MRGKELLLPNAFEGGATDFTVHNSVGSRINLVPSLVTGVEELLPVTDGTVTTSALRPIFRHLVTSFLGSGDDGIHTAALPQCSSRTVLIPVS